MTLNICLPFPPSTNTYWRNVAGRTLISDKGRKYRAHVVGISGMHGLACTFPASARLILKIDLHLPDKRRRDVDNYCKAILDAFTYAGIWADDEQIDMLIVRKRGVAPPGMAEVWVEEITS